MVSNLSVEVAPIHLQGLIPVRHVNVEASALMALSLHVSLVLMLRMRGVLPVSLGTLTVEHFIAPNYHSVYHS